MDIDELAIRTDSYTGADLNGLVRQASLFALKDSIASTTSHSNQTEADEQKSKPAPPLTVSREHFMKALDIIRPSVSDEVKTNDKYGNNLIITYSPRL